MPSLNTADQLLGARKVDTRLTLKQRKKIKLFQQRIKAIHQENEFTKKFDENPDKNDS